MFPGLEIGIYLIILYWCCSIIQVYLIYLDILLLMGILTLSVTTSAAVSVFAHISLCPCDTITLGWIHEVRCVAANFLFKTLQLQGLSSPGMLLFQKATLAFSSLQILPLRSQMSSYCF